MPVDVLGVHIFQGPLLGVSRSWGRRRKPHKTRKPA